MKTFVFLIGIGFILASCSAPQSPAIKKGPFTYGIITLDTQISYSLLASSASVQGFAFDTNGTSKDTLSYPSASVASAYFADVSDTNKWQPAGAVSFNGIPLTDDSGNIYFAPGIAVYHDGRTQNWIVPGSMSVPSFSDTLQGPFDSVLISSPLNASDISESSGLTISWNSGNSSETSLLMVIPSEGGQGFSTELTGSTSSYTIPSATLSTIPKGRATISVSRGVYKVGTASNSQNYIMVIWHNTALDVNLQ